MKVAIEFHIPGKEPIEYSLEPGVYTIGSEPGNKIIIEEKEVNPKHALLILRDDGLWIEDLQSRYGTYLEGVRIKGRVPIKKGSKIAIGSCEIVVKMDEAQTRKEEKELIKNTSPSASSAKTNHEPNLPSARQEIKSRLKREIHKELLERLDIKRLTASHIKESELHAKTRELLEEIIEEVKEKLPDWLEPAELLKEIYDESIGLGPLEDLLEDDSITEIMVNNYDQIFIERNGKLELSDKQFMDEASVLAVIERIVTPLGRRIDESQPYVDARLKDGSRVNAIIPPLALNGPTITIRKFSRVPLTMDNLIEKTTITKDVADFLKLCVIARKNIIVSGGTGSGKTTFLNVLSSFLPVEERIITIEDAAELRLNQPHVVRLEARPQNIEGKGAVTIRDLFRNALRMRPDRIVIGECRGGEALDMLQAMNTGHDGSMTTVHANSPRDVIARLETMTMMSGLELPSRAIREQIASAIHLIVQTARYSDGSRKVTHVTEIVGLEGDRITMQDIFVFKRTGVAPDGRVLGEIVSTGAVPRFIEELSSKGLKINMAIFNPALKRN
jgi:pilus assembly protein CpaF